METNLYLTANRTFADGLADMTDYLQGLIDANPNRTIFLPDGIWRISRPLVTSAAADKSVSLRLSNYAVLKADEHWKPGEPLVRLGGRDPAKNQNLVGSNYSFVGGVLDGNGIADGISIDSGRETVIRGTSVKNTRIGIHIAYGANSGSSDADISGVNIIGTGKPDSIGIYAEGFDNTFTNIRIGYVWTGVRLESRGNMLRNIHPLFYGADYTGYENSVGFYDLAGCNWFDFCYSDHFCTGFRLKDGIHDNFHNCFAYWYGDGGRGAAHTATAFATDGKFCSDVTNFKVGFQDDRPACVLSEGERGGGGHFQFIYIENEKETIPGDAYRLHLVHTETERKVEL